jgi:hypothetical protein
MNDSILLQYQLHIPEGKSKLTDQEERVQPLGASPSTGSLACFPISECSDYQLGTATEALHAAHLHLLGLPDI